jgi:hypothetical protein
VSKVVVITSGKGGVGKTTTSANVATGIAQTGLKTVAIDFDVGLRNLDLVMGCERRVVYDFVNVIRNEAKLQQALIRDKRLENLWLLPASQTRDKDALTDEGVGRQWRDKALIPIPLAAVQNGANGDVSPPGDVAPLSLVSARYYNPGPLAAKTTTPMGAPITTSC